MKKKKKYYKFLLITSLLNNKEKQHIKNKLNKLPRNSSTVRIRNRCIVTSRARGVLKKFKLSRIIFKELALLGHLPGIRKASW